MLDLRVELQPNCPPTRNHTLHTIAYFGLVFSLNAAMWNGWNHINTTIIKLQCLMHNRFEGKPCLVGSSYRDFSHPPGLVNNSSSLHSPVNHLCMPSVCCSAGFFTACLIQEENFLGWPSYIHYPWLTQFLDFN